MIPDLQRFVPLAVACVAAFGTAGLARAAADTCAAATAETGALPLLRSSTTVEVADNYWHGIPANPPQCTASGACTGGGGGRGTVYDGTGWGPDLAYKIVTSANCTLTIALDPTRNPAPPDDPGDDLALFVFKSTCSSGLTDCLCVSDEGLETQTETVVLQAVGGTVYYLVADGYTPGDPSPDPFSQGPFDLSIAVTSGSCTLCPESGCGSPPTGIFSDNFESGGCTWSARVPEFCT